MLTAILIVHGLLAVALLGAITHQALAVTRAAARRGTVMGRFRAVEPQGYSNLVVILFAATTVLGAILYPEYRLIVRPVLEAGNLRAANGIFEVKEQLAALGLLLLPAYWAAWRDPLRPEYAAARCGMTCFLAFVVWWNFLTGHVLNNIHGFFP